MSDESALEDLVTECYADPLRFVRAMWPWGEVGGPLEAEQGPDANQAEFLTSLGEEVRARRFNGADPVLPILMSEASGHGTGKSAMGGWLVAWILSTRPGSVGTVTAGTATQLKSRTWSAVRYWLGLCLTAHWFDIQASGIFAKTARDTWKCVPQTCRKENAQSFAGQHARSASSFYLLDEASEVPDTIFETAYGGLTDGEPMMFAWGQLVRNRGEFYEIAHGKLRNRWNHRRVDSRSSRFTNKALLARWAEDYGVDSDYFKVRVLGLPPSASELQYIDRARVDISRRRDGKALASLEEPLIAGFDVSGGGKAWNVIRFRRGLDGDALPAIRISGESDPDRNQRVAVCAELLSDMRPDHRLAAMFIDSAFGAPIAARLQALGHRKVYETNFGGDAPDPHDKNMRAYMYRKAKDWLLYGALPDDETLCDQLCAPGFHLSATGQLVLEPKVDVLAREPALGMDDADGFVLTFAQAVASQGTKAKATSAPRPKSAWT